MVSLSYYLAFTFTLYVIGLYCLATKRNLIKLILGIEVLINATNVNFIVFSANCKVGYVDPLAHSIVIVSTALAGCVSAVALAIIVYVYRHYRTLDVRKIRRMKG